MDTIKKLFRGKEIPITITADDDETSYLSMNPANKKHLLDNISSEPTIGFTPGEFEEHVENLLKQSK